MLGVNLEGPCPTKFEQNNNYLDCNEGRRQQTRSKTKHRHCLLTSGVFKTEKFYKTKNIRTMSGNKLLNFRCESQKPLSKVGKVAAEIEMKAQARHTKRTAIWIHHVFCVKPCNFPIGTHKSNVIARVDLEKRVCLPCTQ